MAARISDVQSSFALLVGIDDYGAYDTSAGNPPGTSDLAGGTNDVRACFRLCRALGIPPENIHVLTSPKLAAGALGPAAPGYAGEATAAEIQAQVAWLAGVLAHDGGDSHAPAGLFTYSGHGDFQGGDLALCPSDVRAAQGAGGDLQRALGFQSLRAILDRSPGAAANLTCVVDSCHAAAATGATAGGRASLTGRDAPAGTKATPVGERMLMAAAPGQTAYQGDFGGEAHGALTWAVSVVADQWRVVSHKGADRLTITYGDLRERAQRLLDALSFPQQIVLGGPPGVQSLTFFHRGTADTHNQAASSPDRPRRPIQIDPDEANGDYMLYTLTLTYTTQTSPSDQTATAQVLSCATNAPVSSGFGAYEGGMEYWNLNDTFMGAWTTAGNTVKSLVFSGTSGRWGTSAPPGWGGSPSSPDMFSTVPARLWNWVSTIPSVPPAGTLYSGNSGLKISGTTTRPVATWYAIGGPTNLPAGYIVSGSTTFEAGSPPPLPSTVWWCAAFDV